MQINTREYWLNEIAELDAAIDGYFSDRQKPENADQYHLLSSHIDHCTDERVMCCKMLASFD